MRHLILATLLAACAGGAAFDQDIDWAAQETPAGATLTATDAAGPVLQLSCSGPGGPLTIRAFRFTPVGSNEEFAFGTADESYLFVADPTAAGPGVVATGPQPYPLMISLLSEGTVSAVYGSQTLGPLVLPARRADAFVGSCVGGPL